MIWIVLGAFLLTVSVALVMEVYIAWRCQRWGHGPFRAVEDGQQCQACGRIDP